MNHTIKQPIAPGDPQPQLLPAPPAAMAFLWSRTHLLKEVRAIVQAVADWPGMAIAPDRSGLGLTLRGVTLGHVRWSGRLDLPFGPEVQGQLLAEQMASRDPDQIDTDRVVFDVRTAADVDRA